MSPATTTITTAGATILSKFMLMIVLLTLASPRQHGATAFSVSSFCCTDRVPDKKTTKLYSSSTKSNTRTQPPTELRDYNHNDGTVSHIYNNNNIDPVMTMDQWSVLPDGGLQGRVFGHAEIPNGTLINTSPLVSNPNDKPAKTYGGGIIVETYSGSKYHFIPEYESTTTFDNEGATTIASSSGSNGIQDTEEEEDANLLQQIKNAGVAGAISYAAWELAFWTASVPFCVVAYRQLSGHWPDFQDQDDVKKLGAEAFAFANVARFAVPLRIGLALSTTPWIQSNIVDRFNMDSDNEETPEKVQP